MIKFFIITGLITLIIWFVVWWIGFNIEGDIKMRLGTFREAYLANPKKWSYNERRYLDSFRRLTYDSKYRVKLSFPAFVWFICSYHIIQDISQTREGLELEARILEDIRRDKKIKETKE